MKRVIANELEKSKEEAATMKITVKLPLAGPMQSSRARWLATAQG